MNDQARPRRSSSPVRRCSRGVLELVKKTVGQASRSCCRRAPGPRRGRSPLPSITSAGPAPREHVNAGDRTSGVLCHARPRRPGVRIPARFSVRGEALTAHPLPWSTRELFSVGTHFVGGRKSSTWGGFAQGRWPSAIVLRAGQAHPEVTPRREPSRDQHRKSCHLPGPGSDYRQSRGEQPCWASPVHLSRRASDLRAKNIQPRNGDGGHAGALRAALAEEGCPFLLMTCVRTRAAFRFGADLPPHSQEPLFRPLRALRWVSRRPVHWHGGPRGRRWTSYRLGTSIAPDFVTPGPGATRESPMRRSKSKSEPSSPLTGSAAQPPIVFFFFFFFFVFFFFFFFSFFFSRGGRMNPLSFPSSLPEIPSRTMAWRKPILPRETPGRDLPPRRTNAGGYGSRTHHLLVT